MILRYLRPLTACRSPLTLLCLLALAASPATAQVQIRLGDSTRTNYSELHEALRENTPAGDTVLAIMRETKGKGLWLRIRQTLAGKRPWADGLLAFTRLAELREPASGDSARVWRKRIEQGTLKVPPGQDPTDLVPALHALELELARGKRGDQSVLADLLPRIPSGDYDLGDAWVFGRLGGGAADTVAARFLASASAITSSPPTTRLSAFAISPCSRFPATPAWYRSSPPSTWRRTASACPNGSG